jgi:GDP-L-fucose synthase
VRNDISILELADLVKEIVGYKGKIGLAATKQDGTPRILLDVSKIKKLGWMPRYDFFEGIKSIYE